jgi:subfamily B ATP-binding cassette protein MsbA
VATTRRLLAFLAPYRGRLAGAIACMALFAASSGLALGLFSPFLQILFAPPEAAILGPATPGSAPPEGAAGAAARMPGGGAGFAGAGWGNLDRWPAFLREPLEAFLFGRPPLEALGRLCLLLVLAFVAKNLFDYGQSFLMNSVEQGVVRDLRNRLYAHLHSLSLSFFHGERTGILASRVVNDVQYVRSALAAGISNVIKETLVLLAALFWVFWASWQLALIALLVLPPTVGLIVWIGKRMRRRSETMQERMADLQAVLYETLANIRVVKSFHAERYEVGRFARENDAFYRAFLRLRRMGDAAAPLTESLMIGVAALVLWFGGRQIFVAHTLEPHNFFLFVIALLSMMSPLKRLSNVNSIVQEGLAAAGRVFALLDTPASIADRPTATAAPGFAREIRFEDVSFRYGDGPPVLDGVNLVFRKGETVALVGPSGAGKSTLVDLVARFHDPTAGRITLDGVDLRDRTLESVRGLYGVVPQETILFRDTLLHNIAYGRPDADPAAVAEAARAANAHAFIARLPDGYATVIGERGVTLSGGERQRVALARAVFKDPPILVLDEATSSLDSESEALVQEAFERLRAGRTAIVIAHRLSTVQRADRIVVLERGRIVEEGRHADLLEKGGLYRRLHALQFQGA